MEEQEYINYPQTPWYEEKRTWFMIGGAVLLIVIVVIGAVFFVRARNAARIAAVEEQVQVVKMKEELNGDLNGCVDAQNPEVCSRQLVYSKAILSGLVGICDELEGESRSNCIRDVAVKQQNKKICKILEAERVACEDRVSLNIATSAYDYDGCKDIQNEDLRASCKRRLLSYALANQSCKSTGTDQATCQYIEIYNRAKKEADLSLCDRLGDRAASCRSNAGESDLDKDGLGLKAEILAGTDPNNADTDGDGILDGVESRGTTDPLNSDSDNDGLSDGEEVNEWGTDPNNADTDGDGFNDADEIKNGYSPLGEGLLVPEAEVNPPDGV